MNRVLVTGASGFVGRHVLEPLRARDFDVHAVSLRAAPHTHAGVTWHRADLCDAEAVGILMTHVRPTTLLHFAWSVVPGGVAPAAEHVRWVQATLELLRAFERKGGRRAVLAGSCAEYDWEYGYCVEDLTPLVPRSFYGVAKNAVRQLAEAYATQQALSLAWARIFFVYGPHEPLPRLVPSIVSALVNGQPAPCTHGDQFRDYLHVEDVAEACVTVLASELRGPVNVSSGVPVRVRDIAEHVARRVGRPDLLRLGARATPPGDPPLLVGDPRRLIRETGWKARYPLDAGLDHTLDWWAANLARTDQ